MRNETNPYDLPPVAESRRYWLYGLGMAGMVGIFGIGGYAADAGGFLSSRVSTDVASGCRRDGKIAHTTLVMVDQTDGFSLTHKARLSAQVKEAALATPEHGKLVVVVIDGTDNGAPREVFSRCAPANPTSISELQGQEHAAGLWRERFEKPLLTAVGQLGDAPAAPRSPIIAAIAQLTQRPDFDVRVPSKLLVLVSDGLEHDPRGFSHMKGGAAAALIRRYRESGLAATAPTDLTGVTVKFDYLLRPEFAVRQTSDHRAFWRWWLQENGAKSISFVGVREPPSLPAKVASQAKK